MATDLGLRIGDFIALKKSSLPLIVEEAQIKHFEWLQSCNIVFKFIMII